MALYPKVSKFEEQKELTALPLRFSHFHFENISYSDGLRKQEHIHHQVRTGALDAAILTLTHPPVVTLGKHGDEKYLLVTPVELEARGIHLVKTDRGGEVTAHMPGQLLVYPILPVRQGGVGPKGLVNEILGVVIKVLSTYGITGVLDPENPGVWVRDQKICAVGIRIRQRVSCHGIALNINNDLSIFDLMVPCGIENKGVTSMALELGHSLQVDEVKEALLEGLGLTRIFSDSLSSSRKL